MLSKPPTSILWYATFDIPTFWCDMRFEELWATWPSISLSHKSDPRFVRNWESCEARFPWKSISRNQGAVGRIICNSQSLLNARRVLLEKTQVIWCGWDDTHFPWKTPGIARVGGSDIEIYSQNEAHAQFIRYTQRFRRGWRGRHINLQSKWGQHEARAIYTVYTTISPGLAGATYKFTVKMKPTRNLYGIYTTISPSSVADWGGGVY